MSQGAFPQYLAWQTLNAMLADQLGAGFDVQAISDKDFNENGDIIMTPPSVRTFWAGSPYSSTTDSQRLSYEVVGRYMILCGAEDRTSPQAQAIASAKLAHQVATILAGARILLSTAGDRSEPITIVSIDPVAVIDLGTAYGVAIEFPALAQFPGTLAAGYDGSGVTA